MQLSVPSPGRESEMPSLPRNMMALLPFTALLFGFATLPGAAPRFWHRRSGWLVLGVVAVYVLLTTAEHGTGAAAAAVIGALAGHFLPFITVLMALYTLGGGVLIAGGPWGRPIGNLALLALGTVLASLMGTIGASLLLIHPLLAANSARYEKRHLVIAFILLVANAGGALTPLGNPPLLIGFLRGVPFFWPARFLLLPMLIVTAPILALTFALDVYLYRRDPAPKQQRLRLRGGHNVIMLLVFVAALTLSGIFPGPDVRLGSAELTAGQIALTALALGVTWLSDVRTARAIRIRNRFAWAPMREIAWLFLGIFVTIPPVLHQLAVLRVPKNPALWFWSSGFCSAFLDSAPTYLIFFKAAGGRAATLFVPPAHLLRALSAGSVFFGALTYLGNAPNLMIRSIASSQGIRMPGFLGYFVIASLVLIPIFLVETIIFFV